MEHKEFIKKSLLFFIILFFVTIFNVAADDLKDNSNLSPEAKVTISIPQVTIHTYNVSNFGDLEYTLGIPYYQIIAKALKVEGVKHINYVYFYYPGPLTESGFLAYSIANIKKIIILDKGKEIGNDLVKEMRDQILSEIIRYEKFLTDKTKKRLYHLPTANELFINGIKVFTISDATYRSIYGYTTGYDVALWKDGTKLIFCTSTYSLDKNNFLKEYVGNISNLLKEYKIKEYIADKLNENQRRARGEKLEYIRDFLETLR